MSHEEPLAEPIRVLVVDHEPERRNPTEEIALDVSHHGDAIADVV